MCVWCWRREEVGRWGITDVFDVGCGVCIVSRGSSRWTMYWYGCGNVTGDVEFGKKQVSKHAYLLLVTS